MQVPSALLFKLDSCIDQFDAWLGGVLLVVMERSLLEVEEIPSLEP